jgi:hypothetical protein
MGFPKIWLDWISTLLTMTSTRVVISGSPSDKISHARGLGQGDPLSPMLFLLVMEVLHALVHKSDGSSILKKLGIWTITFHMSLYVDDVISFLSPVAQDL